MDYDEVLLQIGGGGKFQIFVCILLGLTTLKTGLDYEMLIYQFYTPSAICTTRYNASLNSIATMETHLHINNVCEVSRKFLESKMNNTYQNYSLQVCQQWNYSSSVLTSTVVTEFNLMCEKSFMVDWLQSVYFLGCTFGNVFGLFGDKIGRKRMLLFFCVVDIITSTSLALTPGIVQQFILRFLRGLAQVIVNQGMLILVEICSVDKRSIFSIVYWSFYSLGYILSAGVAFYFTNWRAMQLVVSLPCLIYLTYPFLIPESPRWLILKGRKKEAVVVLNRIASINGRQAIIEEHLENLGDVAAPSGHWADLISTRNIFFRFIIVVFLQTVCNICYAGLSTDAHLSSNNIFLNVLFMGLVEFPGIVISCYLCEHFGRRRSTFGLFLCAGICMIVTPLISHGWLRTTVAIGSKFFVNTNYLIATVILTEAFPTSIRSLVLYLVSMIAWLSTILVPHINSLSRTLADYSSGVIYGCTAIICGLTVMTFLIETKGRPLAQTVGEDSLISKSKLRVIEYKHVNDDSEILLSEFFDDDYHR